MRRGGSAAVPAQTGAPGSGRRNTGSKNRQRKHPSTTETPLSTVMACTSSQRPTRRCRERWPAGLLARLLVRRQHGAVQRTGWNDRKPDHDGYRDRHESDTPRYRGRRHRQ
jgi:hypothetical protein